MEKPLFIEGLIHNLWFLEWFNFPRVSGLYSKKHKNQVHIKKSYENG